MIPISQINNARGEPLRTRDQASISHSDCMPTADVMHPLARDQSDMPPGSTVEPAFQNATMCLANTASGETKMPVQSGILGDDPFRGRHPTSHERETGQPWDASYHDGPAPWDIGLPQPAIVRLASRNGFTSPVLDAGCGTGENTLHVASLGL